MSDAHREPQMSKGGQGIDHPHLEEIVRRIVEVAKPDRIILFGSAARGQGGPESDLDFLVVKAGVHRRRLARQIYRSLFGIPVPVDVIVVTPEDVEAFRGKVGTTIGPALQEGREVYAA
jgi:predicted nucleotidyltransferase